jgi:hypothetical protein
MKIELKAFKYYKNFSEETNAFTANIYIDGKKTAYAKNDGRGGCTYYSIASVDAETKSRLKFAEDYCKSLPKIVTDIKTKDGTFFSYDPTLESVIDDLVTKEIQKKFLISLSGRSKVAFQDSDCGKGEWATLKWNTLSVDKAVRMNEFKNYIKENDVVRYFDLISKEIVEVA